MILDRITELDVRKNMVGVVLALCKAVARLERAVKVLERKELGITIDRDAPEEDDTANLIKE